MYPRILIINETIYSRAMLKNILDQLSQFIILEAENGKEVIETLTDSKKKSREFEYIFLDFEMKKEDSLEILKKIREIEPLVEVIICGGSHLTDENIKKSMEMGVKRFLTKPYKLEEVKMVLEI
ncbi:response regulator [Bacillus cereus]|uniref:response regulator n=1 Tax=Bacillus cereus TaxID=1396 RepID=UPI001595FA94|nr:response regulator [Bacillus cereus]